MLIRRWSKCLTDRQTRGQTIVSFIQVAFVERDGAFLDGASVNLTAKDGILQVGSQLLMMMTFDHDIAAKL